MRTEQVIILAIAFGFPIYSILTTIFLIVSIRKHTALKRLFSDLNQKIAPIVDIEGEIEKLTKRKGDIETQINEALHSFSHIQAFQGQIQPALEIEKECRRLQIIRNDLLADIEQVKQTYAEKRHYLERIRKEIQALDERSAFAALGFYEPHFDFQDSETFKNAITSIREKQKALIRSNQAAICEIEWTIDGSRQKGAVMTALNVKLTLRAFNGECDAAISNARWNNIKAMEARITRSFEQINKYNESNRVVLNNEYLKLKLNELYMTHEYREKLKAERDERAEMARLAKEEMKLARDVERAEEEEARYQRLLEKAKRDASRAVGTQIDVFNERIRLLEADLADAHAKAERAQAMAQKTKSGYVYIISNIGSFGDDVVKIGLTRRLDPADRIRELGDASVPFLFDTHAVIYSEDAPALERSLHAEFEAVRVNAQNARKEFFRASISEVETAVQRLAPEAPFFRDIEAQEYRETLARRNAYLTGSVPNLLEEFPETI